MKLTPSTTGEATYCPEDNKLRLYVGRVPRAEFDALRAEGWAVCSKQREEGKGDFAAVWTPKREDTARAYASGYIGDEDAGPAERAADRAERFAGYQGKRIDEATGDADRYDGQDSAHGYQNAERAERAAARHDRIADRALDAWGRAEYWQSRTAGVIGHALYVSQPGVRMGRIKKLEAELRKIEADSKEATKQNQATWDIWHSLTGEKPIIAANCAYSLHVAGVKPSGLDEKYTYEQARLGMALMLIGNVHTEYGSERYQMQKETLRELAEGVKTPQEVAAEWISNHPERPQDWTPGGRWHDHIVLRLAYERQMLEGQGGTMESACADIEAGGWVGKHQIQSVHKSPVTGRVSSVKVWGTSTGYTKESGYAQQETRPCLKIVHVERLSPGAYRPPTDDEREAFKASKKTAKAERVAVPFINPTPADAERLQAVWNAQAVALDKGQNYPRKPGQVAETTQATFSANNGDDRIYNTTVFRGVKVRVRSGMWQRVEGVVVLTDKPQKPLPASMWESEVAKPAEPVAAQMELVGA